MRQATARKPETGTALLEAAKKVLHQKGYSGLSTRDVAAAAGVPLSQIHYHFGSKQGLMLALFDYLNAQLLDRQNAMFHDTTLTLSQRWDRACDYLDEDIASGYVRVLQELIAASWSDPEVARVVRTGLMGWFELIADVARQAEKELGGLGSFSPEEVAALVSMVFIGGESLFLLGAEKKGAPVRQSFAGEAPRWVPDALYRRVFDRMYNRLRERLVSMAADPGDATRRQFDAWIAGLPDRLETSPELRERGEQLKRDLLGSTLLRDWSSTIWQKIKEAVRAQAADPASELRRRLAGVLMAAGRRLASDERLHEGLERMVESGARAVADHFHDDLAGLVTGTIERWDAAETSSQLELLLGRDLQFIRINGTVVGAGVGLILHAVVQVLG